MKVPAFTALWNSVQPLQTTDLFQHDLAIIQNQRFGDGVQIERLTDTTRVFEVRSLDRREIMTRLEQGHQCYLGIVDGRPAHFSWVQGSGQHEISDAGISVDVAAGELWIYHCHTAAWARGRRLYPQVLSTILRDARAEGTRKAWIYTTRDNVSSRKGILRAGFVYDRPLRALKVGRGRLALSAAVPVSIKA